MQVSTKSGKSLHAHEKTQNTHMSRYSYFELQIRRI